MMHLYLAGDSTVKTNDIIPPLRLGWGQTIEPYLKDDVRVHNHAASGRSTKSFINEGRLKTISDNIKEGDYLFIQFGHNDQKPDEERHTEPYKDYQENLMTYVNVAKKAGATPVLLTSVCRRHFDDDGNLKDTHGEYVLALRDLAAKNDLLMIDLEKSSRQLLESLGDKESIPLLFHFAPGEHKNEPDGVKDDTHFSAYGANEIAKLVVEGIKALSLPLVD